MTTAWSMLVGMIVCCWELEEADAMFDEILARNMLFSMPATIACEKDEGAKKKASGAKIYIPDQTHVASVWLLNPFALP